MNNASIEFLIFFVVVFFLYHFFLREKTKQQNILLLISGYVFYAWANWKILPLLVITTAVFYLLGIAIFEAKTYKRKQWFTTLGITLGIGTLLYFKYFNFFITSFKELFEGIGWQTNLSTFKILLPVGISFYTFRLLSYVIDIHREKNDPTRDFIAFATYVAFFPCILAGPIDRPATLLPQLKNRRIFDYSLAVEGMRQILWGFFKKAVIADNCALCVNEVFAGDDYLQSGSTLLFAAVLFSFQMYADFSGYSDVAIGVAKLLGFRITKNFDYPFFARNIAEYWRKWHISLTSWLTDYVFMPLNVRWRNLGNRGTTAAIMLSFILIGLWHGDNWTFVIFGLYHGLLYIPLIYTGAMFRKKRIKTYQSWFSKIKVMLNILLTFGLVTAGNIIFRAENTGQAFAYFRAMMDISLFSLPVIENVDRLLGYQNVFFILFMMIVEWNQRKKQYVLDLTTVKLRPMRFAIYYVLIVLIFMFCAPSQIFIYFQF